MQRKIPPPPRHAYASNPLRGRGATINPIGRFERLDVEPDDENRDPEEDPSNPETLYLRDSSKSALASNDSPDIGFDFSLNPYRGCLHGCSYCYARPTHEYLGFSAGLDFETKILVKEDAPDLLRKELASRRWQPQTIALSGVTDPYQPVERRLRITRRCLEVLAEARNPVAVITKNHLVTRDIDLLASLAELQAAMVHLSIPTLDPELARVLEPRASTPKRRLLAIERLAAAGVPVGVMVAPVIPGLTDHEIPHILESAASAGARTVGWVMLRLPFGVKDVFEQWLLAHRPDRAERVLARLRDVHDGKLYRSEFGTRGRGTGRYAEQIATLFEVSLRRAGLTRRGRELSTAAFRRPDLGPQIALF
ncbi:MAG TPA: PA0069 family radical SAM protein [Thermoanaerobaculia bacterium]|nr:PA0069 family radical SAM protein [Thermoanaerobaculia bacterium]